MHLGHRSAERRDGNGAKRFSRPADESSGRVSVVLSFNNWTPGKHRLQALGQDEYGGAVVLVPGHCCSTVGLAVKVGGRRGVQADAPQGRSASQRREETTSMRAHQPWPGM